MTKTSKTFTSDISGKEFALNEKVSAGSLGAHIISTIKEEHPAFSQSSCLSLDELNMYREKYIANYLVKEIVELGDLEHTVLNALKEKDTITDKMEDRTPINSPLVSSWQTKLLRLEEAGGLSLYSDHS